MFFTFILGLIIGLAGAWVYNEIRFQRFKENYNEQVHMPARGSWPGVGSTSEVVRPSRRAHQAQEQAHKHHLETGHLAYSTTKGVVGCYECLWKGEIPFFIDTTKRDVKQIKNARLHSISVVRKEDLPKYMDMDFNTVAWRDEEFGVRHTYSPNCPEGCYGQLDDCTYKEI